MRARPLEVCLQISEFLVQFRGQAVTQYRFGEFELLAEAGFLRRDGVDIPLQPQVFGLLTHLLENRGRIVSKDELVEMLWGGRIVSDAVLNTRVRDLRRALGDDGREQRYIRTYPKRGLQFVAEVDGGAAAVEAPQESDASTLPSTPQPGALRLILSGRKGLVAAGLALLVTVGLGGAWLSRPAPFDPVLALPDQPSIAVLRFATDGSEANVDLSVGLAEDLIADLSQFKELFVISRNSSFSFDPDTSDPRDVGRELGVEFVARGSARTMDEGIRVTAELVDSRTGEAIWTERFDRPVSDVFAIQDEISDAISGRILPELVRARADTARQRPTDDLSAWDLFLQAKAHQAVFSRDGQERAIALSRAALDRDPNLAAAHSLIAQARGNLFFWSDGDISVRDGAIAAARQALEMDPNDPMAHAALGYVYRFTGDQTRAIGNLERAVALNPNSALIRLQFAHTLDWFRHQERALPQIEAAIRLSPRDPLLQNMFFYKAHILYHLQRYDEAREATDAMGAVVSSGPWEIFYNLMRAAVLAELDRGDEARAAIDAARRLDPSLTLTALKSRFDRSNNHPDNRAIWLASLEKAGLSDK